MASIRISDLAVIEGHLPPRALGLVMEWAAMHRKELIHAWTQARANQRPDCIEPLP
ncbi:MAG TPA: DUF4160 domain-containing protein [Anaerohalosphaeraceae bacterium]|nr:DUF4160 domain-containing protein [Anaerohalosphaeraceae bacterium]HRT85112.1 DUF4160 domain-containing protein [Anaerohalosphaeraceae bacterium]